MRMVGISLVLRSASWLVLRAKGRTEQFQQFLAVLDQVELAVAGTPFVDQSPVAGDDDTRQGLGVHISPDLPLLLALFDDGEGDVVQRPAGRTYVGFFLLGPSWVW